VTEGGARWRAAVVIWGKGVEEENATGFDSLFAASMVGGRGFHQLDARRPRVADDMKRRHRWLQYSGRKKNRRCLRGHYIYIELFISGSSLYRYRGCVPLEY
jgi:hypothetical protein